MKSYVAIVAVTAAIGLAAPVSAEGFEQVRDEKTFLDVVGGKKLTRFGIKLDVLPTGKIQGRAFGQQVSGAWRWNDGYFCRDLYFGQQDLGANCQKVLVRDETVRFISDRGTGQFADLRLE